MADPHVDLWATDEVHFQQHGSRCRMWIPPETKDPILLHAPTRKSVGYFGAVRLRDGRLFFQRETDKFNAASFWDFLQALYRTSAARQRRVVVITDNAKYHHARLHRAWREQHTNRFALDYLPPYSPDSTRSNAFGNSRVDCAYITDTSPPSTKLPVRSRVNSQTGLVATLPCAGYAQLIKTLRLRMAGPCRFGLKTSACQAGALTI